jgi:Trk-type K+ transport system membrane component
LPVIFAGFAISFPCLLPVSLVDQTPFPLPAGIAGWPDRALSCLVGGAFGWAVGCVANSFPLRQRRPSTSLPLTLGLLGIALGWQAVLTIAVLWLATVALLKRFGGRLLRPRWLTATTLLFVIAMLHHPAWKWLAGRLSF